MEINYSIIIPVYNTEKYIEECLESILAEKREDVEIILVNDGSTDSSLEICAAYAERYPLIRLINQENGGVSAARNAGIKAAGGKWILFADSDDYIFPGMFQVIDHAIDENKTADSFIFAGDAVQKNTEVMMEDKREDFAHAILGLDCENQLFTRLQMLGSVWNKVYSREHLVNGNICFSTELVMGEDKIFNIRYFMNDKRIVFMPGNYYYYRPNFSSASKGFNPKIPACDLKFQLELRKTADQYHLLRIKNEGLLYTTLNGILVSGFSCYFRYPLKEYRKYRQDYETFLSNEIYREALKQIRLAKGISVQKKLLLYLLKLRLYGVPWMFASVREFRRGRDK